MKTANKNRGAVILVCTGLGRVQRGFEMYIASLAQKLPHLLPGQQVEVWSGGSWRSAGVKSRKIASLGRNGRLLSKRSAAFLWEQRSFALGMLPLLLSKKQAVIYLGEYQLYCYLFKIRRLLGLKFSLVLYTGGQALPGLFDPELDFVHHVTNRYLGECSHIPPERQFLVPHFMENDFVYDNQVTGSIRGKAGGKKIVLSVGLLDCTVKRMDLLVKSLAALPYPVYPVLLGDISADTPAIRQLLETHFGEDGFTLDRLAHRELGNWYRSADLFVLCSPKESFGLAPVEAVFNGLPVICADFPEARFVLKQFGIFAGMSSPAELARTIAAILELPFNGEQADERRDFAFEHYSWQKLQANYSSMFQQFINN